MADDEDLDAAARRSRQRGGGRHHLGLRARVTATFTVGALLISSALCLITYFSVRDSVLSTERSTGEQQVFANALLIRAELRLPDVNVPALLSSLSTSPSTRSLLLSDSQWFSPSPAYGPSALPARFASTVIGGSAAQQIYVAEGGPELVVGVPLPPFDAAYFEIFGLQSLLRTLHILLLALVVAGVATTLAGAVVGRWAAGRSLRPLRSVSDAALAIASGQLDTRLVTGGDADLSRLAYSFNDMADRLQGRIERDARFTSDVSHELRSPLTTLQASLSVLEARREELPPRAAEAVELLGAEIRRFREMVAELLEISKIDAGSAELTLDEVDVLELTRQAVATSLRPSLPIEVDGDLASGRILVDKRRFERIIANLVENGERYAGGCTQIRISYADHRFSFAIDDAGPGVAPEEATRIFERFSRGSAARRRGSGGGTGLGLALVAEHVRLHGGEVFVGASPDRGARFVFRLPAEPQASQR